MVNGMNEHMDMIQDIGRKQAHMLIDNHESIDDIKRLILDSPVMPMDSKAPACRFRGTVVDIGEGFDRIKITGWQRNVSRLCGMDISLPTIITLRLGPNEIIEDIELDSSFKGSKGLMCCRTYLNRNLKSLLQGQMLDSSFINKVKVRKTHCFHIFEVLSGIYSYYQILRLNNFNDVYPHDVACEEEAIDSYRENGTIYSAGVHLVTEKTPLHFHLTLHDILGSVGFDHNGFLKTDSGVCADFIIDEKHILSERISIHNPDTGCMDMTTYLFKCINVLKQWMCPGNNIRMFNTNLYPASYIGMLMQSVAIRLFNDNYHYIMHAITSLQRAGNVPLCVGAVMGREEAFTHFPGFDFSDLI
jgi:hypothetical protein